MATVGQRSPSVPWQCVNPYPLFLSRFLVFRLSGMACGFLSLPKGLHAASQWLNPDPSRIRSMSADGGTSQAPLPLPQRWKMPRLVLWPLRMVIARRQVRFPGAVHKIEARRSLAPRSTGAEVYGREGWPYLARRRELCAVHKTEAWAQF